MKKVLYGLKIAVASILAIVVSNLLNLEFSISAGIVAILTIAPTKKETIKTVIDRFLAFIVAILIAFVLFSTIGFTYIAFFIYLIIYIVICKYLNWGSAMAVNSVLVSHFLTLKLMSISTITNELLLFIIGALFGVLVNLHLRANNNYMSDMYSDINVQLKKILYRMSERMLNPNLEDYNGYCFTNIEQTISNTKSKAEENYLNSFSSNKKDFEYINSIEKEVSILFNIYTKLKTLNVSLITSEMISQYFKSLSDTYELIEKIDSNINNFYDLKEKIRKTNLPQDREEFENRAKLYVVLEYLEELLLLKKQFTDE